VPAIDIPRVCQAMGANVLVCDPFDLENTQRTLCNLLDKSGLNVLVLKQICALSPEKKNAPNFEMSVDKTLCVGENCGCNQLCTRIFKCPGLIWNKQEKVPRIDDVICIGCGVCASICPSGAIRKKRAV
jgi:indolepyruvate ferredoxin oxidoreductase alpha subunit